MAIVDMRLIFPLFAIGACAMISAEIAPEATPSIKALNEWTQVCQADGTLLWRKSLCGPVILVDPSTRSAIAYGLDPEGKFQKHGDVYIGVLPGQFTPSNTSIRWKQQEWAMVKLPLPADPFRRLALLAHESFQSPTTQSWPERIRCAEPVS